MSDSIETYDNHNNRTDYLYDPVSHLTGIWDPHPHRNHRRLATIRHNHTCKHLNTIHMLQCRRQCLEDASFQGYL